MLWPKTAMSKRASRINSNDAVRCQPIESLILRYECRDGTQRMWISPIVRTKDGVALADALEMGETAEGRFASLF